MVKKHSEETKAILSDRKNKYPLGVVSSTNLGMHIFFIKNTVSLFKLRSKSYISKTPTPTPTPVNTTDREIERNKFRDKFNPYFITGFSDAESCFSIGLYKDDKRKTG